MKKQHLTQAFSRTLLVGGFALSLLGCQSSSQSQSSSSMPSIPSASSSSSSSSAMPSIPSSSPSSSASSPSMPSSSSMPSIPSSSSSSSSASSSSSSQGSQGSQGAPSSPSASSPAGSDSSQAGAPSFPAGSSSSGSQGQAGLPGSESRFPESGGGADIGSGRDSATGDASSGDSGTFGNQSGGSSGDYSLDTLPDGVFGGLGGDDRAGSEPGTTQPGNGTMAGAGSGSSAVLTTSEQAAVLDDRLRRGYEEFDGFILGERERAQAEINAAGPVSIGSSGSGNNSGDSSAAGPQTLPDGDGTGGALENPFPTSPVSPSSARAQNFPAPEDIPSGRDDDVVARQLREAAMAEADPELREKLWDEYRNYTGIANSDSGDSNE